MLMIFTVEHRTRLAITRTTREMFETSNYSLASVSAEQPFRLV